MSKMHTRWQRDIERIGYEYVLDLLTMQEAITELRKFGFNSYEAGEYLDSCYAPEGVKYA